MQEAVALMVCYFCGPSLHS